MFTGTLTAGYTCRTTVYFEYWTIMIEVFKLIIFKIFLFLKKWRRRFVKNSGLFFFFSQMNSNFNVVRIIRLMFVPVA